MKTAPPTILLSTLLAALVGGLVGGLVSMTLGPDDSGERAAVSDDQRAAEVGLQPAPDVTDLRMTVARMEDEVQALQMQLALLSGVRREVLQSPATDGQGGDLAASLQNLDPVGEQAFFAEVSKVVDKLEEAKEAAALEEEMAERQVEAADSYAEYEEVDQNLDTSVSKLANLLGLGTADVRDMRSLLALQNDRNREVTRLWSSGKLSEEELGDIFMENRAAHRSEILALVGDSGLPQFKKFVQGNGLGGRFSFFTAPWESWDQNDAGK